MNRKNTKNRRGSATVEFALIAPIFFMLIFGSIEFARVHMIQAAVENACFEGARRGIVPGATSPICKTSTESLLTAAGVRSSVVSVEPSVIDATTQEITVTAVVPLGAENIWGISGFFQNRSMTKSVTLPRERR